MAVTITIEENLNLGSVQGRLFKAVTTTSTANTITAASLGLSEISSISPAGGLNIFYSGAVGASSGSAITYSGVTASSGTAYGLALGR